MFDVIIIGYGPVGATLANFLGADGWRVAVIETNAEIYPIPRAVHIDDEAQRIFQAAGVLDLVEPSFGGYPPDRQYINASGEIFFETHLNKSKPFGYQSNMYFHQPTLEEGLREGVARFANVEVFLNTRSTNLNQNSESVTVRALQNGEREVELTARYLVGCDGARSFVRKALNIDLRDLHFEQPWLVTDFYLKPGLTRDDVGFPYAHQQICDPQQPISFIPNGVKNHYRFEFMLPPNVTKAEAEEEAYVHKMLAKVVDLDQIDIVRGAVYTFHSLIAKRWRDRRIFIAGDAAHQMPPFAGQGMCSGLRDAHNLSWKLDLVLRELADDKLLDIYERERKPHVTRMTRGAMFLGNLVQTQNPIRGWLRDLLFRTVFKIPAVFGRIAAFALRPPPLVLNQKSSAPHCQKPRWDRTFLGRDKRGARKKNPRRGQAASLSGSYFPQPAVTDAAGNILLLDDLFGANFVALGLDHDPAAHFSSMPERFPLRCIQVARQGVPSADRSAEQERPLPNQPTPQIMDHTGRLADWFEENRVAVVLLRPDRFVFGAYSIQELHQAAAELSTQLFLLTSELS